jgi:hypothetical protein
MLQDTNKKVVIWLGWKPCVAELHTELVQGFVIPNGEFRRESDVPDYANDDSIAVKLLSDLVERGYNPKLYHSVDSEGFDAWYFTETPGKPYFIGRTVAEAITAAVRVLADSM